MLNKLSLCAVASLLGGACVADRDGATEISSEIRNPFPGPRSGFAWQNGFANDARDTELETLLSVERDYLSKRGTDVFTSFLPHEDLLKVQDFVTRSKVPVWTKFADANIRIVQVVPLLFVEDLGHVDDVLRAGTARHARYLELWRTIGRGLAAAKAKAPVLRLGHEMNLGDGYPWSVNQENGPTPAQFRQLFTLAGDTVREDKPDAVRCWNPGKASGGNAYVDVPGHRADDLYPGDDSVDVVGLDWYDNGGGGADIMRQDADWDDAFLQRNAHGPVGIGAWYAFARAHDKPFAFPEWALTDKGLPFQVSEDRTVFIDHMHQFFVDAAQDGAMMFESYYNSHEDLDGEASHQLFPVRPYFKQASLAYQRDFAR